MNAKLTLSFNSMVIDQAKVYARNMNTSLSKIVEGYFTMLIKNQAEPDDVIVMDEDLLKISGDIGLAESIDTKDLLSDQLMKKYIHD